VNGRDPQGNEAFETTREREARSWWVRALARLGIQHRPHEGPLVGPVGLFQRLWHLRLPAALFLSAPALFLCFWYAYGAVRDHLTYNRAFGQSEPLTLELFHLHLHDQLNRDWRRAGIPTLPSDSELRAYFLYLGNDELAKLEKKLPPSDGKGKYVSGYFRRGKRVFKADLRYRGNKHWHWNYAQKSWKVRLRGGGFLDGENVFGLINTPETLPFGEEIVLGIAREQGLMTPEYFPLRLYVNNAYLGVYYYAAQPDEGILRESNRFPGNLFSGNEGPIDPVTGVSRLWLEPAVWKKVASLEGQKDEERKELEVLLGVVAHGTAAEFERFAQLHLDLDRFVTFDALDVIFGGNEHDFHQNHKLYFDPYRGRFEPVGWSFRGWRHEPLLNRTDHPLLLRLKELPEYTTLRNRKVFELVRAPHTPCSVEEITARAFDCSRKLTPELEFDPYWDAARLLPSVSRYFRQMVRPMDEQRQQKILDGVLGIYGDRISWIVETLAADGLSARLLGGVGLEVTVDGNSGYRLDSVVPEWEDGCAATSWQLRSVVRDGALEAPRFELYPAATLVERVPLHPFRGSVRSVPAPQRYLYSFDAAGCVPARVAVEATHLVTGNAVTKVAVPDLQARPSPPDCTDVAFDGKPGRRSLHPWCSPVPAGRQVTLGPGDVRITGTQVYGPLDRVGIAPGTRLLMGPGASLVFRGRVDAAGTVDQPIVAVPEQEAPWGGIALVGPATAGSSFSHLRVSGGAHPEWSLTSLPATFNLHDTRRIRLSDCVFADNAAGEEMVHAVYVKDLLVERTVVARSGGDAFDFEFCSGGIERSAVFGAGDDCLDLMGSNFDVNGVRMFDCTGSALSAGERSRVQMTDSLLGTSRVGILAKNNSRVDVEGSLFWRCATAVDVDSRPGRYEGKSRVRSEKPFALDCERLRRVRDGGDRRLGVFAEPGESDLPVLRAEVLGLESWEGLEGAWAHWRGVRP
jgi:hypothetical protein